MRIEVAHAVLAGVGVVRARREPGRDASRYSQHAQHQRHRAGELLAVAGAVLEQERGKRELLARGTLVVAVLRAEMALDRAHRVVGGRLPAGDTFREALDPR